jgi:NADH-quinone oxidoreductase subunit N
MNGADAAQTLDVARYYAGGWTLLPEYIVGVGAAIVLVLDAFRKGPAGQRSAQISLLVLGLAFIAALGLGGGEGVSLYSGMVVLDPYARFFRILFLVAGLLGVILTMQSDEVSTKLTGEYYSMFLGLVLGMMLMAEASDIVMVYLSLELVSLMSYVLAGFRRHDRKSAEAALKYVIYGGAASGAMLFGLSLVYGLTGETQLSLINQKVAEIAREAAVQGLSGQATGTLMPVAMIAGLVLAFVGFAYKIAAVPLHMWSPDVYEGAPTPFTAFLSTGPKAAGFAALVRFFVVGFSDPAHYADNLLADVSTLPWPTLIMIISALTMILGNLAAIGQNNIKRFLAYSSIAHAGYTLVGLAAFSKSGAASVLIYMAFYVAMNIGAFYAVIWVRDRLGTELISDYKGLGHRAPLVCVSLAICLFSLTGLPPLAGFIGKYYLFAAILERGVNIPQIAECAPAVHASLSFFGKLNCTIQGSGAFYTLALIGVLNSAVSLYYYARVVRSMFLEQPEDPTPIASDPYAKAVLVPICAFLLIFGVYFAPLANAARSAIDFKRPTVAEVSGQRTPSMAEDVIVPKAESARR